MKKRNLKIRLQLQKQIIASLHAQRVLGGTDVPTQDPTEVSLGKQSTCPIETCTCTDAFEGNCEPVRL